jgi:hypothetical protein
VFVALAAVLAVLLVGATVQLVRTRTSEQFTHYTSTNSVVHYSLDHPADWRRVEDVSSAVVFSPRAQAISTLFFGNGAGASWTGARQLLRTGATDTVGLYVYSQESNLKGTPPAQFRQSVTDLSPLTTTITSSTETTVSGAVSDQIDAVIADPGDPSVRLGADIYVCQPATGGLVVFTFVAAPDKLDSQEPVISKVLSSVKWLPAT